MNIMTVLNNLEMVYGRCEICHGIHSVGFTKKAKTKAHTAILAEIVKMIDAIDLGTTTGKDGKYDYDKATALHNNEWLKETIKTSLQRPDTGKQKRSGGDVKG